MNLRIHDFRHIASTNLRRAGVDTATAMKKVGHKSDRMHPRQIPSNRKTSTERQRLLDSYQTNTVITPDLWQLVVHP